MVTLNELPHEVIGVLPAGFDLEFARDGSRRVELVLPLSYGPEGNSSCRSCRHLRGMGKLRAGTTPEAADRVATAAYAGWFC